MMDEYKKMKNSDRNILLVEKEYLIHISIKSLIQHWYGKRKILKLIFSTVVLYSIYLLTVLMIECTKLYLWVLGKGTFRISFSEQTLLMGVIHQFYFSVYYDNIFLLIEKEEKKYCRMMIVKISYIYKALDTTQNKRTW